MGLNRFIAELRRRRVMRVIGVYAVAAWAAVEVTATVAPLLQLPEWTPTLVVILALAGFPLTVGLAWVFDLTAQGVVRTLPPEHAPAPAPARTLSARAAGYFGLGILVALVAFAAYAMYQPLHPGAERAEGIRAIAVLPFVDLSPNRDQEYFSDGITEELLNRLAQVEGLHVPARTSSFAFKGRNEDVGEIGRTLRVQAVLEGSVRKDGDQLRVTAQLVDARTGYHLWSATYDRRLESVFSLQDEIAVAIVDALQMQLAPAAVAEDRGTDDVRAHDYFLLGLASWHARTDASVRAAIAHFDSAVALDPEYALAHAGLAQAYAVLPTLGEFPLGDAVAAGTAAAARALAIDAQLAEAHAALGQIAQNFEWELGDAERAYRRALDAKPGYATAHQWYAETLLLLGRHDEAREEVRRALELDPLSPAALNVRGYLMLVTGDAQGALGVYRNLATTHPGYTLGQLNRALAAVHAGATDEAIAAAATAMPSALQATVETIIRGATDPALRDGAARAAGSLDGALPAGLAALWFAALGDHDQALRRLRRSYDDHAEANLPLILVHPLLQPLHVDEQFREIARGVGVRIAGVV